REDRGEQGSDRLFALGSGSGVAGCRREPDPSRAHGVLARCVITTRSQTETAKGKNGSTIGIIDSGKQSQEEILRLNMKRSQCSTVNLYDLRPGQRRVPA